MISIIIPLYNEEESLAELHDWIKRVCERERLAFEILFIDDGSTDRSWEVVSQLASINPNIKGIRFLRNYGKSAALHVGFRAAQGDIVITMDADLQDSADEIPELVRLIREERFDLVSGWKKRRHDPLSKTIPTRFYNWATRAMSGIRLHDFNCGLKAYRREVVQSIEIYGEMHRYIPVIAYREGFRRIGEKVVEHRPRKYGTTKFGFERFINGFLDLLTITFISRFGKRPMHFFGTLGVLVFMIGFVAFGWIGGHKIYALSTGMEAKNIADQSIFYLALTSMIIGTQLFLAGFLGELISRNAPGRNDYHIAQQIGVK